MQPVSSLVYFWDDWSWQESESSEETDDDLPTVNIPITQEIEKKEESKR